MRKQEQKNFAIASGLQEITQRFGSAGAEFIKGYSGIDYENNKILERGLKKISEYKIGNQNSIKQQAGFSAEVATTAKKNAEKIIKKSNVRFSRSEDFSGYGKNNTVVDIVEYVGNKVQSESQMKFVTNIEKLLTNIAQGENGGKNDLSRYLDIDKLELPTEQVEQAKKFCEDKAKSLLEQADAVAAKGEEELADKFKQQAENYKKLKKKIKDSGITTEEAIAYRENPLIETVKDITNVSHRAGIEGAKFGAAIGGCISLISNTIATYSNNKEFSEVLFDTTKDTLTSAGVGYATGFSGAALKGVMQQSSSEFLRQVSKTGLPAMVVATCLATGKSIYQFSEGELELEQLFLDVGATVAGALSTATFSAIGQVAIPIPVLGGIIGGMIGYTLTNMFYFNFANSFSEKQAMKANREFLELQCLMAQQAAEKYQAYLNDIFSQKIFTLEKDAEMLFNALSNSTLSADEFGLKIDQFSQLLGKSLPYKNMEEFSNAIALEDSLTL